GGAARGHPWAAAAGALLFGLHPLQVETVAWASGLKDLLAGAFGLAAVALYLRATADAEDDGRPRFRWPSYLLATACLVLAALSKPSAVVVPGLAGVIELIWLRRPVRGVVMRLAPWVLLMAPVVVVGKVAQPGAVVAPTPVVQRPVVAGASLAFYAGKLVLPVDLAFDYGWKPPVILARPTTWVLAGAAGAVLVGLAVAVLRWRDATGPRAWLAGTLWMTAALLPVLGLVPFHYQQVSTVADHYAYVALVGPALVLAWLIARRDWAPRPRLIIAPTLVVLFIALAARSVHQFGYWEGTEVFARRVLAVTPRSALGHSVLGRHLMLKPGRQADAEASMRAAIRYEPLFLNARTLLVTLLATQGRVDEAVREIHDLRAVNAQLPESDRKDFDDIFLQTGQVTLETGRPARAVRYFEEALKLRPGDPRATEGLRKAREAIATPRSK
ncbi:MAG TPA: hypothetical protein VK986_22590, partial [Tepidisphaeraceae bacterium]|nr:hypothetical protein [Tepidisphaeraceae bacterium]